MSKEKNIPPTYKRSAMSLKTLINKVCAERGRFKDGSGTKQFYTDIAIELMKVESQRWIPVSERLPEETVMVLVNCEDYYLHRMNPCIGWRNGKYWSTFTAKGREQILYPIEWRELPELYKADKENKE